MKPIKFWALGLCLIFTTTYFNILKGQEAPKINKTELSDSAKMQTLFLLDGQEISAGKILEKYHGKTTLLYIWAMWCPDCLNGFPELFKFQKANPDIPVVFFSLDREEQRWREGIDKFKLNGDHYWFKTGWKNDFTNAIDLNWIPRYMILGPDGKIAKYYAVKADDPELQKTVNQLRSQK